MYIRIAARQSKGGLLPPLEVPQGSLMGGARGGLPPACGGGWGGIVAKWQISAKCDEYRVYKPYFVCTKSQHLADFCQGGSRAAIGNVWLWRQSIA